MTVHDVEADQTKYFCSCSRTETIGFVVYLMFFDVENCPMIYSKYFHSSDALVCVAVRNQFGDLN